MIGRGGSDPQYLFGLGMGQVRMVIVKQYCIKAYAISNNKNK